MFRKCSVNDERYSYITVDLPKDENKQCNANIFNKSKIETILDKNNEKMVDAIEIFIENGSNYQLYSIGGLYCNIDKYQTLKAKSYTELPDYIKNKKCCINVKNKDDGCFAWAVMSCLD